jgi:hypothetical protein
VAQAAWILDRRDPLPQEPHHALTIPVWQLSQVLRSGRINGDPPSA